MAHLFLVAIVASLFVLVAFADSSVVQILNDSSVVQILKENGLPPGLLPSSVVSYSLSENGKFVVLLQSGCTAKVGYQVYYQKQITGELSYGKIENLAGISAHELFVWLPVTGIHVDVPSSGWIYFDVGFVSKKLSIDLFKTSPTCNRLDEELQNPRMNFSAWLAKALNGELEITGPRKMLLQ